MNKLNQNFSDKQFSEKKNKYILIYANPEIVIYKDVSRLISYQ